MSWRVVKLGELIENFSVKAKDYSVEVSALDFFGVSNTEGITKSKHAAKEKANDYKIIEKGCFAYNPYRINVGSIAMLDEATVGLISPAYVVFKVKEKSIIPELLLKFLKSSEGLRQIKSHARGTVRQALRFSDLCEIEIALPDFEEQLEFYKLISKTEIESNLLSTELTRQLDLVKQLRQAFLREAMEGKLIDNGELTIDNEETGAELLAKIKAEKEKLIKEKKIKKQKPLPPITKEEIPFKIPDNWVWCRLGDIIKSMTNGIYKEEKFYADNGTGCFRMYNINEGKINFDKLKRMILTNEEIDRYLLTENDLLLNRVNSIELLGKLALLPKLSEPFVFESKNIRVVLFEKKSTAPYINYLFLTPLVKEQILKSLKKVTGQASISQVKLNPLLIPLPPLSEQKRIVAKLDELMAYCDRLEESIKKSQTANEMLLQQVLREALEPPSDKSSAGKPKEKEVAG
jgi:type I restriction enzyme S subunit